MDPLLIFFCSKVLNEFIRIFIWIHPYNFSRNPGLPQDRHCAKCCSCTGFITVISQINFLDITLDQSCMPCCQCSPQWSYRIRKSGLMERDHIHISFAKKKVWLSWCSGTVQTIKVPALIKNDCLRWIQIFRFPISHHTATKSDHTVIDIHNWKHHTIPKLVVHTLTFIRVDQSGLSNQVFTVSLLSQILIQIITVFVRKSQSKRCDRLIWEFTVLKITVGLTSTLWFQLYVEILCSQLIHLKNRRL